MTIFLKERICNAESKTNAKAREAILEMIVLHFPERHLRDYIQASRLYYDYNYADSKAVFGVKENEKEIRRLPVVLNL